MYRSPSATHEAVTSTVHVVNSRLWKAERMSSPEQSALKQFAKLPRKKRYMYYALSVVRTTVGLLFIFAFMALMPDNPGGKFLGPIVLGIGGVVFYVWYFKRQIKQIGRSNLPGLRAVEALILVVAMFLAIFAASYVLISTADPEAFTVPLDDFTAYYYSLTVLATVGFGDITPVGTFARSVSMIQMALDIAIIGVAIKVMSGAAQSAMRGRVDLDKQQDS